MNHNKRTHSAAALLLAACIGPLPCVPAAASEAPAATAAEKAQAAEPDRTTAKTPAQLKAGCDRSVVKDCSRLADRYSWTARSFNKEEWKDDGLAADAALEHRYRLRACELGSVTDCGDAGRNFLSGEGVTKDVARAIQLLTRACDADDADACNALAGAYKDGTGVKADARIALELEERACRLGSGDECGALETAISDLYSTLGLPENSPARPLGAEVATCRRGDANACMRAALRYYNGQADDPDIDGSRAASLLAGACDGGIGDACWLLGNMLGQGVRMERKNVTAAAAIYLNGCNLQHGLSCSMLGDMYRRGIGVSRDVARADQLRESGCTFQSVVCPEGMRKTAEARRQPASAPAAPAPFTIVRARLGHDTVESIQRDIQARGGAPGKVNGPQNTINALTGDFRDGGPDIIAVNYDFNAAGSTGRLVALTIVRKRPVNDGGVSFASMVTERKAAVARDLGPLQQKSATEFTTTAGGVQATLHINDGTGYLYEVYKLAPSAP